MSTLLLLADIAAFVLVAWWAGAPRQGGAIIRKLFAMRGAEETDAAEETRAAPRWRSANVNAAAGGGWRGRTPAARPLARRITSR